ncbi:MAG: efflux RND transporter permease subunit [Bacteroidetes bacterium]|nr:efflux RND transporter permease subunit [Bacteroidota bacterium]
MAKKITQKIKDGLREFGLTSLAVDNATSVFILTFMLLLFGLQSYNTMPKESFPEIPWPQVYVNTVYFGNSAADIENLVTRPIEQELASISELKTVTSSSQQDYSLIVAEFDADVDIDDATRKVKDAVDRAKPELPNDLTSEPEVLDINLSEIPILTVNVSGKYSNDQLREYAEYLQDELEDIKEISSVDLKGSLDREVSIEVDLVKMQSLQVSFGDIDNAIASENVTMSGGELLNNDFRRTIRIIGEFKNVQQIRDLIVKSENQDAIYLKDIAEVNMGFEDRTSIARASGLPVISLDVIKRSGENLLDASDKIKVVLEEAQESVLPDDLDITIFNDQSVQTRLMVSNLENSIISGVILVVLVLLFFLGLRNSMFVGVAIPLSMLMGILIINLMGYTLNMVVLFSLILALGMLVDNAIVVVENVYRYMQNGYSAKDAARYGASEVALPIIASTATTLAAFVPLAFWPGLMGSFMKFLPITLIIVLSSSLFVALVINPVLTATFMKVDERADDEQIRKRKRRNILIATVGMLVASGLAHVIEVQWMRNALWITAGITLLNFFALRPASFWFQQNALPALERAYHSFIRSALHKGRPYLVFGGTFLLLIVSFMLLAVNMPKIEFFPAADPLYVNAFVEMPVGTDIEATNEVMEEIEEDVTRIIEPYGEIVEAVLSQVGENTSDPNSGPDFGASPHKGRLTVSFVPTEDRGELSSLEVMEKLQAGLKGYPGVKIVIAQNQNGPPTGLPINIEVSGEDINTLANLSQDMLAYLENQNIAGVEELKKDVNIGKPELIVEIDRESARRYGISTYLIADAIRTSVFGKEVSKFKEGDDEYPIQLRLNQSSRYDIDDVLNQRITFRSPATGQISQVPIAAVADVSYSSSYTSINRKDQERMITIYSNVLEGYVANDVVNHVKASLANFEMPDGYSYEFTGEQQEQAENMEFLSTAFLVAIFAIFLIIVAQFNSMISPIIIILSVLFSTIGVLLGYVFSGMNIVLIMTGVGIISLAGIVVNNAIVLIDYINLLVKRRREELGLESMYDMSKEDIRAAIVLGGATRLRPVLLTAITTVLGLVPLAIGFNFNFFTLISDLDPNYYVGGDNAAFWGTMAWTVIYGLVFATFLTLVVVPAMYWLAYLGKGAWKRFVKNL